jgi:glutamate-1-semialdehyde 2,1-aminomutase
MTGQRLYERAKQLIPGGTQLLSKRPEMFLPDRWPCYFAEASGVEVTDLDGKRYVDMSLMGLGACILGYGDDDVDHAVREAVRHGVACTLNAPEEVSLAELLIELHPWAQMVRYTRSGGEAMAAAVRIARASTGRDFVAFCGYHGCSDWYLAANLGGTNALDDHLLPGLPPAGVPRGLVGTAHPFHYNRPDELRAIVEKQGRELAAIVMEPQRGEIPSPGFLEEVRTIADETGAVLIFDEITSGFRVTTGGIHRTLDVEPDIAVFAKALGNGYAMAALIGREPVMQSAQDTFLSSTNWTERIGPAAALATVTKHRRKNVAAHLAEIGVRVRLGWERVAARRGLPIRTGGLPSLTEFTFEHERADVLSTLFTRLMLDKGYLASTQFKPSYAHTSGHIDRYLDGVDEVFATIRKASSSADPEAWLDVPVARRGFYRLA